MRVLVASLKIITFLIVCFITIPAQALGGLIFGNSKLFYIVPTTFYRLTCFIFRIKVTLTGDQAKGHVMYVGNHLSYIDIAVIGAHLQATFISKADVRNWPIFGLLAQLGKTVFIERSRNAAEKCIRDIRKTLQNGRSLILFPEGTSTQGIEVLPFKSSVFEIFLSKDLKDDLVVQPFTISLQATNGQDILQPADHDLYAWYADMEFWPHLWALANSKGASVLVSFHPSHHAKDYEERKIFAAKCQEDVALGLKKARSSHIAP